MPSQVRIQAALQLFCARRSERGARAAAWARGAHRALGDFAQRPAQFVGITIPRPYYSAAPFPRTDGAADVLLPDLFSGALAASNVDVVYDGATRRWSVRYTVRREPYMVRARSLFIV